MAYQSKRKVALFTALCLFCSMSEFIIPKPTFVEVGFSNIPLILSLYSGFSLGEFSILALTRILSGAFLQGIIFKQQFLVSLAGGISGSFVMWLVSKSRKTGPVYVSTAGAFVSNCFRTLVEYILNNNEFIDAAPVVFSFGMVISVLIGLLCRVYAEKSVFMVNLKDITYFATLGTSVYDSSLKSNTVPRISRIVISSALLFTCCFTSYAGITSACSIILLMFCLSTNRRIRIVPIIWLITRVMLINIILPSGWVLISIGDFKLTSDSLLAGIRRSFIVLGVSWFSSFIIPNKNEEIKAFRPCSLLYMTFAYFKTITENWYHVDHGKNIIERADNTIAASIKFEEN